TALWHEPPRRRLQSLKRRHALNIPLAWSSLPLRHQPLRALRRQLKFLHRNLDRLVGRRGLSGREVRSLFPALDDSPALGLRLLRHGRFRDVDDYDVLSDSKVVGRIFRPGAGVPAETPWMWSILERRRLDRPCLGYEATRDEAMAAFAKSWRGT